MYLSIMNSKWQIFCHAKDNTEYVSLVRNYCIFFGCVILSVGEFRVRISVERAISESEDDNQVCI